MVPTIWVAPVRSHCTPMTISWLADAGPAMPAAATTATNVATRAVRPLRMSCSPFLAYPVRGLSRVPLVRERPDPEVTADVPPQTVEPLGFQHEEHDDERAEQAEPQRGDQVVHRRLREEQGPEPLHGIADHERQEGDEERPEDG